MTVNREIFTTNTGLVKTLAMEVDAPTGQRTWAVVLMRLQDEITESSPSGPVRLQVQETGFQPRVAADGFAGLVANPFNVFPNLQNQSYPLHVTVYADGYVPTIITPIPEVAQALDFPADFVPKDVGVVRLHALPTVIRGRVVQLSLTGEVTPIAGAVVDFAGYRPTIKPPVLPAPPFVDANILAITPPLYANRDAGVGVFSDRAMTTVSGQNKTLVEYAAAGSRTVKLSNRTGVLAGRFLAIEPGDPERTEIMEIDTFQGGSTVQQSAYVTFKHALAFSHPRDALVRRVTLQASTFNKNFSREAYAGDTSVYLDDLTSVVSSVIEISGGSEPPEFHRFQFYSATSSSAASHPNGAVGYYRLPPIQRAGVLSIRVSNPPQPDITLDFVPDYGQAENEVNFVFRP